MTENGKSSVTIRGAFERFRYRSPDSGWSVGMLQDGTVVVGTPPSSGLAFGCEYAFYGNWRLDPKFGEQFCYTQVVVCEPLSRQGVVSYLRKHVEGIGPAIAGRLFDTFGTDAVKILRCEPERAAAAAPQLSLEKARRAALALQGLVHTEEARIELAGLFDKRHFPAILADRCIEKFGILAPKRIRHDPFTLMVHKMPGCGFARCDTLYKDLGLPVGRLKRQLLYLTYKIDREGDGNTWFPRRLANDRLRQATELTDCDRVIEFGVRARWLAKRADAEGREWIALNGHAKDEADIARRIRTLNETVNQWPSSLDIEGITPHQAEEVNRATQLCIGVLGGNPGTGKTYTTGHLIAELLKTFDRGDVVVCAPTGKAAVRITEAMAACGVKLEAVTIHRMLGPRRNGHDGDGWNFQYGEGRPLPYRFIVVDESSMCDVNILACLLRACRQGTHVLFVGDFAQLPPVGHGAPLRDLIAAGLPYGELTETHRNMGLIVDYCRQLKESQRFGVNFKADIEHGQNVLHVEAPTSSAIKSAISTLVRRCPPEIDPIWDLQVLCALNEKSDVGRLKLNPLLQTILNPDGQTTGKSKYRVGDKAICVSTNMYPVLRCVECGAVDGLELANAKNFVCKYCGAWTEANELSGDLVCNGEIGEVVEVTAGSITVQVPSPVRFAYLRGETTHGWDLAYAITTHKSQGSQWKVILVVADDGADRVASWEWWRVGLSRAETLVITVGKWTTIARQCKRSALAPRKTFLREMLAGEMEVACGA